MEEDAAGAAAADRQGSSSSFTTSYWLVPLGSGAATKAAASGPAAVTAEEAWQRLAMGLGQDPQTQALARRFFGGAPTQVVALSAAQAANGSATMANPDEGYWVAVRLGMVATNETTIKGHRYGRPSVAGAVVIHVPDMNHTAGGPGYVPSGMNPQTMELFEVLANDYFLRHGVNWELSFQFDVSKPAKEAAAFAAEIEDRIAKYEAISAAYYRGYAPR